MCSSHVLAAVSVFVLAAAVGCSASAPPEIKAPEAERAESKASSSRVHWADERRREADRPSLKDEVGAQAKSVIDEVTSGAPGSEPERTPVKLLKGLTAPGVAFMVEYSLTDAYRKAVDDCIAVVGDEEVKRQECSTNARAQFGADAIRFREDDGGQLWWLIYRRNGEELVETYSARIEFTDVSSDRVTMKILGPGKGKRPLFKERTQITIGVPNEYSIEIDDADLGHLVYDAKVGLVR